MLRDYKEMQLKEVQKKTTIFGTKLPLQKQTRQAVQAKQLLALNSGAHNPVGAQNKRYK